MDWQELTLWVVLGAVVLLSVLLPRFLGGG